MHHAGKRGGAAAVAAAAVAPGGGGGAVASPQPLAQAVREVLCRCPEHADAPLLAVRPPALINKRGRCGARERPRARAGVRLWTHKQSERLEQPMRAIWSSG